MIDHGFSFYPRRPARAEHGGGFDPVGVLRGILSAFMAAGTVAALVAGLLVNGLLLFLLGSVFRLFADFASGKVSSGG